MALDPDTVLTVRELVRRKGFRYFIRRFWPAIESVPFIPSWHIDAQAEALEAVAKDQIGGLVINQPPGTSKSTIVSVMWPAWLWTLDPADRFICTAYGDAIVLRDAGRMLQIVQSELYQVCWPDVVLTKPRPALSEIETVTHGRRYSTQIGGQMTGFHGRIIILDDPIKPSEALTITGTELTKVNDTIKSTLTSRFSPGVRPHGVCIMQRLASGDPADMLLDWGYEHLMLPMRYVPGASWDRGCSLGKLDLRTEPGELLCPDLQDAEAVDFRETGLETPQNISAQMQQNPIPSAGAFFEDAWFREYETLPKRVRYCQTWDLGFKGKRGQRGARDAHSRVHGALWAWTPTDYYLVDETIGIWNYPETKRVFAGCVWANARKLAEIKELTGSERPHRKWPRCDAILVEDKANGPALLAELKDLVIGLKAIEPDGSKEDRAARHSMKAEQGLIWLPRPAEKPWVPDFKAELIRFPRQKHNDRVDTTTQALDYMADKTRRLAEAYKGLADWR
jgi:predicted phage terminase large subunit-like protein